MRQIIFSLIYLLVLFLISNFIFEPTYLYYEIWWLDIPMHILGGLGVASLAISVLNYKKVRISFSKVMLSFLVIAVLWEVYEYSMDFVNLNVWGGWRDTFFDIINGFVGSAVAYLIFKK